LAAKSEPTEQVIGYDPAGEDALALVLHEAVPLTTLCESLFTKPLIEYEKEEGITPAVDVTLLAITVRGAGAIW
jgi:hypothetical protein